MKTRPNIHVKKNDVVVAISGVDAAAGKSGKVLQVLPAKGRVVVEGMHYIKKCMRKSQENPKGGIVEKEAPFDASNVMLYCPKCKKGVRIRKERVEGKRVRKCAGCDHAFD